MELREGAQIRLVCPVAILFVAGATPRATISHGKRPAESMSACMRRQMGVTSDVAESRAEEQKAKSCFQKVAIALTAFVVVKNLRLVKVFKTYRGGVLVVRSNRLHKVARTMQLRAYAVPHLTCRPRALGSP